MKTESNVIPGFEQLSPEQVIKISLFHILTTQQQCKVGGTCSYASFGCAAAPFLTEEARKTLVGSWRYLVDAGKVPNTNGELIAAIQRCHDEYTSSMRETGIDFVSFFIGGLVHVIKPFCNYPHTRVNNFLREYQEKRNG